MELDLFTDRKVYKPLAAKLPEARPAHLDLARWSKAGQTAGPAAQRGAHFNRYQNDPDIAYFRSIPEEAWDPKNPAAGEPYGIVWITLADLHPSLTSTDPFAAAVFHGQTLFTCLSLSATTAHIVRDDGSEENGATWLTASILNHYRKAENIRYADDLNRATRTDMGWALIKDRCKKFGIRMVFGGQVYDLGKKADRTSLGVLTVVSTEDDSERREKLTGKKVAKYDRGGAAIPEHCMPKGWHHEKDQWGRPKKEDERGFIPEADASLIPFVQELWTQAAEGDTYQRLHTILVRHEAAGTLKRRDHINPGNTYASAVTEGPRREAVEPFFAVSGSKPKHAPSEELIVRYLHGEDPADLFDLDVRIYLARVELMRTGYYFRRLANDMDGIGTHGVNGYVPTMRDDDDTKGAFYVMSERWAWPVVDGKEVPRLGLTDELCRRVGARLLREVLKAREDGGHGGRNRADGLRRAVQNFGKWTTEVGEAVSKYDDEPTEWGVRARTQKSGKNTFCVMHRRVSEGPGVFGYLPDAGSGSLAELTSSLALSAETAARTALEDSEILTLSAVRVVGDDPATGWEHRIGQLRDKQNSLAKEATGYDRLGALAEADGDAQERDRWLSTGRSTRSRIDALHHEIALLNEQIASHRAAGTDHDTEADLNVLAFLIAGLKSAAANNGLTSHRIAELCEAMFIDWHFMPDGELLHWTCAAQIPVATGNKVLLPLFGSIRNLRTETGRKKLRRQGAAHYVFGEGRPVDQVAGFIGCSRSRLYNGYLMPWLIENGIKSSGMKCALVDHPAELVRQIAWRTVNNESVLDLPVAPAYVELIRELYFDPTAQWGHTTVRDDTTWIQRALDILNTAQSRTAGKTVAQMALLLGQSEWKVRQLLVPRVRQAGFRRPRYLEYADEAKTRIRPITCPHDGQAASVVCLVPEVAASGFGVLCPTCARVPSAEKVWHARAFPEVYLERRWTGTSTNGSIIKSCQTVTY